MHTIKADIAVNAFREGNMGLLETICIRLPKDAALLLEIILE